VGLGAETGGFTPQGRSLWNIAAEPDNPDRVVFSEYHAAASPSAEYMIRKGQYKFIYYVGFAPELFDMQADPEELNDLAGDPAYRSVIAEMETILRGICDPEEQDLRAKARQQETIEKHGGRAALEKMGWLQGTPVPGEEAEPWQ
jgi:choline-sulfatase